MKRAILTGAWGGLALSVGIYEIALALALACGWTSMDRAAQAVTALALGLTWLRCEWQTISEVWNYARGRRRWVFRFDGLTITSGPMTRSEWVDWLARFEVEAP